MGDQVVVLMQGINILKVLMCRDRTHEQMMYEVRQRWGAQLLGVDVKVVIANVVSVESPYINFNPVSLGATTIITKE